MPDGPFSSGRPGLASPDLLRPLWRGHGKGDGISPVGQQPLQGECVDSSAPYLPP